MIRAIVSTALDRVGPTLVSPDSITASAPSSTAFATSEASARVGRGVRDHRLQHLGRHDDRLGARRAFSMTRFWRTGTSSSGHSTPRSPRATITPSKASTIPSMVLDRLRLLDLGDHRDRTPSSSITLSTSSMSVGAAHEAQRDQVDADPQREAQVLDVLLRQRRHRDGDPGQVDPLVVADLAADHDARCDVSPSTDRRPRAAPCRRRSGSGRPRARRREALVRRPALVRVARDVAGGDRPLLALLQLRPGPRRTAEPDLRALEVGEDADAGPLSSEASPHELVVALVVRVAAVAMFSRATSIPASTSSRISPAAPTAGPRVQTILAPRTDPSEPSIDPSQ